jgi:hypothetical protein
MNSISDWGIKKQKTEDRRQKSEDRSQETEFRIKDERPTFNAQHRTSNRYFEVERCTFDVGSSYN